METLGISRQWLHRLSVRLGIHPQKKIIAKNGRAVVRNYFTAAQIRRIKEALSEQRKP